VPTISVLGNRQPHIQADEHQRGARQKRDAPAKGEELFVGEPPREREKNASGKKESGRCAELGKHAVPGALPRRRILDRQQHRAAPLAAKAQPLPEAKEREKRRRDHADGPVSRQSANRDRGEPHGE
jgi:hypothetical protein